MYEFKFQEKISLASSYESLENYLHAIQIYTSLINEDENYLEPYFRLIQLYEKTGRIEQAAKVVNRMTRSNFNNDYALITAAEFHIFHSNWKDALNAMSNLDLTDYPIINYWKGLCYFNLKEYEFALISLEYSYEYYQGEDYGPNVIMLLAKAEYELGNFKSALFYAEKYEFIDPEDWEINLLLAQICFELDLLTKASIKIEKALRKNTDNVETIKMAAKINYKNGNIEYAEKYFNLFLEKSDEVSAEIYSSMASIALKRNDLEKARLYFELALKIEPGLTSAANALNSITFKKNL